MKNNSFKFLLFVFIIVAVSCKFQQNKINTIDGLWIVKKVKAGEREMTPIARWMKFNTDSTQTSGNGWLQHSVGTWSLSTDNKLIITNINGLVDNSEPFNVILNKNAMTWSRLEDGE